MDWQVANDWAANLEYGGYDDWRLPKMLDTGALGCRGSNYYDGSDCGFNVQTVSDGTVYSELATMYYVNMGLKALYNPDGTARTDWGIFGNGTFNGVDNIGRGQRDIGLIHNLQADDYWTSVVDFGSNIGAWGFSMLDGRQESNPRFMPLFAWPVRDGDVAAVSEPPSVLLFSIGIAMLGALRWRGKERL